MVGQYLPFGILACEHVAGTVVGERRRARIRAHPTYDIPKAISRVNRPLAARVGDFGEVAVGVIRVSRISLPLNHRQNQNLDIKQALIKPDVFIIPCDKKPPSRRQPQILFDLGTPIVKMLNVQRFKESRIIG